MKKEAMPIYNHIIMYDDKEMIYLRGSLIETRVDFNYGEKTSYFDFETKTILLSKTFIGQINDLDIIETIKLDETLMKRIAKYNKIAEINKMKKTIKEKEKKIENLDNILQDKDERVKRLKQFIANIYDLDLEEEDDCCEYYD